tara:strand:- start:982 stop:1230 length:249 start_codon:yes stop_codon:yes gene_type:complete
MLNTQKNTTYIFITSLSLSLIFSVCITLDYLSQKESKNIKGTESLYTGSCDCSCFEAFLLEENKELKKLTNCYKNQIEIAQN